MTLTKVPPKKLPKAPVSTTIIHPAKQKPETSIKQFHITTWQGDIEGEKGILYADSGMGKTTLASMLPKPVFIGLDDGGRKIKNPKTGENLKFIPNVITFDDARTAVQQVEMFDDYETLVIDTGTEFERLALEWTLGNVMGGEGNNFIMKNIEQYGWGKGYRHLYDTMRLPLADFDALIRRGKNVFIICQMEQVTIANPSGADFLCDVPKLQAKHGTTPSIWGLYCEWADHILRIAESNITTEGKKATSSGERIINVHKEIYFKAKSRTISPQFPVVTFSEPSDDSIWKFLFDEVWKEIK